MSRRRAILEGAMAAARLHDHLDVRLTEDHDRVSVYPHTWEVYRYGLEGGEITANSVGSFTQFPIRLAWAVTISTNGSLIGWWNSLKKRMALISKTTAWPCNV